MRMGPAALDATTIGTELPFALDFIATDVAGPGKKPDLIAFADATDLQVSELIDTRYFITLLGKGNFNSKTSTLLPQLGIYETHSTISYQLTGLSKLIL